MTNPKMLDMIIQTNTQTFHVKSMTAPDKYYTVPRTGNGGSANTQIINTANLIVNTFTSY